MRYPILALISIGNRKILNCVSPLRGCISVKMERFQIKQNVPNLKWTLVIYLYCLRTVSSLLTYCRCSVYNKLFYCFVSLAEIICFTVITMKIITNFTIFQYFRYFNSYVSSEGMSAGWLSTERVTYNLWLCEIRSVAQKNIIEEDRSKDSGSKYTMV